MLLAGLMAPDGDAEWRRHGGRAVASGVAHGLRFTLLYHPDLRRIGARATTVAVPGYAVPLSRLEPEFAQPRSHGVRAALRPSCEPETSPCDVGRRRVADHHARGAGDSCLSMDSPSTKTHRFPPEALRAGLLLQLSRRIVILVHRVTTAPPAPRYGARRRAATPSRWSSGRSCAVADLQVPVLLRGDRRWQGARRAGHPSGEPAGRSLMARGEHGRACPDHRGRGAVRARERGLHGRSPAPRRPLRARARWDALPR